MFMLRSFFGWSTGTYHMRLKLLRLSQPVITTCLFLDGGSTEASQPLAARSCEIVQGWFSKSKIARDLIQLLRRAGAGVDLDRRPVGPVPLESSCI